MISFSQFYLKEVYRRSFSNSTSDIQDLLRVIYYNLQEPGEVSDEHPNPILSGPRWEKAMESIEMAIRDAAMEGVDLTDLGWGLRDLEDKMYFSGSDADRIVDMINTIEGEIGEIESDYEGQ